MEEIVNGINVFREAFAPFADSFIVIGGSACRAVIPEGELRCRILDLRTFAQEH
jgi:hypothetical protein